MTAGWECDIFSFELISPANCKPHSLVIRLYPSTALKSIIPSRHKREYQVMNFLKDRGYPIPQVHLVGRLPDPSGRPFLIMDHIKSTQMIGHLFSQAEGKRQEEIAEQFCGLLVQLHECDIGNATFSNPPEEDSNLVSKKLTEFGRYIQNTGLHQLQPVLDWLKHESRHISGGRPAVVHWDYHPENVLITQKGTEFVVDWSSAEITDYRFDIGSTCVFLPERLRDRFILNYEELSGRKIPDVLFFEAAGCFRRLLVLLLVCTQGPDKLGLRPEVEEIVPAAVTPHMKAVRNRLQQLTGVTVSLPF